MNSNNIEVEIGLRLKGVIGKEEIQNELNSFRNDVENSQKDSGYQANREETILSGVSPKDVKQFERISGEIPDIVSDDYMKRVEGASKNV